MTEETILTSINAEQQIAAMTDAELADAAEKLRKRAALQSELSFADLHVARYEPPSDAVDRQLDRNLIAASRITNMQRLVREEIERRTKART